MANVDLEITPVRLDALRKRVSGMIDWTLSPSKIDPFQRTLRSVNRMLEDEMETISPNITTPWVRNQTMRELLSQNRTLRDISAATEKPMTTVGQRAAAAGAGVLFKGLIGAGLAFPGAARATAVGGFRSLSDPFIRQTGQVATGTALEMMTRPIITKEEEARREQRRREEQWHIGGVGAGSPSPFDVK